MRVKCHSGRSNATFLTPFLSVLPLSSPSRQFPPFTKRRRWNIHTTTVFSLSSAASAASATSPWLYAAADDDAAEVATFLHPLTLKPLNLPQNPNLRNFEASTLTEIHRTNVSFDKLVIAPPSSGTLSDDTMVVLYDSGKLIGRLPLDAVNNSPEWFTFSNDMFDDVVVFKGKTYAVDRLGKLFVINCAPKLRTLKFGKTLINRQITPWYNGVGWRKRLLVDERDLYLVVRETDRVFRVYKFIRRQKPSSYWVEVKGFDNGRLLLVSKDCCFFMKDFRGKEYENCIVFSESGFPEYRCSGGRWEYSGVDELGVFSLRDGRIGRVGESVDFPDIDWSPPSWVFDVGSCSLSPSRVRSERRGEKHGGVQLEPTHLSSEDEEEPEVMEIDSDSEDEENAKHSNSKDAEGHEVMELDSDSQDVEQEGEKSDSDIQDQDDGNLQCDPSSQEKEDAEMHSNVNDDGNLQCDPSSQEKEDAEMHSNVNVEGDASVQEDVPASIFASVSSSEEEICTNAGNDEVEKESTRENVTPSAHEACTSSASKSCQGDTTTTKFEGFEIRSDLVPTLQKIWLKHGNIVENSTIRSGDIIATALESLATMVHILENNSVESLSDCQADYLNSSISDLSCLRFKVKWLTSSVEKAVKLQKSRALVEELNKLSESSSRVKESKAVLLEEIDKLTKEENKLKAKMVKVSKMLPFSGQLNLDDPVGSGLD